MWVMIIICNVGIAIVCWRVVFWMLQFRLAVANFRQTIVTAEENCRSGLGLAPESLWVAQSQVVQFRQCQRRSNAQWGKVRQGWQILFWGKRFIELQSQWQQSQWQQSQWRSGRNSLR